MIRIRGIRRNKSVTLYALSTCGWCRRTKELLGNLGVEYDYCDVDELSGEERRQVIAQVMELNPHGSYPTLKIGDEVIVGYDEDRIRQLLKS